MVLDRKNFDELDDFCDFDEKLDATSDDFSESGPNHPLAWRRVIIEKAVTNVKKAFENKADVKTAYKKGALLFDEEAAKFGRVVESRPGFLNLSLLGGGKLVRQDINELDFIKENRHQLTLPEMAEKLSMSEIEVIGLLNQVELASEKASNKVKESQKPVKHKVNKAPAKKPAIKISLAKNLLNRSAKKKPDIKISAKKKDFKKKSEGFEAIGFTKLLPKGATTDPVMDPNGYIQQNFLLMSNRELAVATGLSEHTIRRKLGEWNLKRKDFINKA